MVKMQGARRHRGEEFPAASLKAGLGLPPACLFVELTPSSLLLVPPGQTVVNIFLEARFRRAGYVLSVYASTGANNLWRLCAYFAGEPARRRWQPSAPAAACLVVVVGSAASGQAAFASADEQHSGPGYYLPLLPLDAAAALLHLSKAPGGGALVFEALAWAGAALSCLIILIFEPVSVRLIPVVTDKSD